MEGENSGVQAGPPGERQIEKAAGYGGRRFHPGAGRPQAETLAGCIKSGAGGGESQCGFLLAEIRHGEPPACVQQSHLPAVAEEAPAKAVRRRTPGRDRRDPGRGAKASQTAASAAKKGGGTIAQKLGGFVTKNKHTLLIVGGIGLILMLIMGLMQSCTSMFRGRTSGLVPPPIFRRTQT